jgi:hypothetical protein
MRNFRSMATVFIAALVLMCACIIILAAFAQKPINYAVVGIAVVALLLIVVPKLLGGH